MNAAEMRQVSEDLADRWAMQPYSVLEALDRYPRAEMLAIGLLIARNLDDVFTQGADFRRALIERAEGESLETRRLDAAVFSGEPNVLRAIIKRCGCDQEHCNAFLTDTPCAMRDAIQAVIARGTKNLPDEPG